MQLMSRVPHSTVIESLGASAELLTAIGESQTDAIATPQTPHQSVELSIGFPISSVITPSGLDNETTATCSTRSTAHAPLTLAQVDSSLQSYRQQLQQQLVPIYAKQQAQQQGMLYMWLCVHAFFVYFRNSIYH